MANLSHLPRQWRESGLTQREFCEREGIALPTFSYWRAKELKGELSSEPASPAPPVPATCFAEVLVAESSAETHAIEITYPSGTKVRIPLPGC